MGLKKLQLFSQVIRHDLCSLIYQSYLKVPVLIKQKKSILLKELIRRKKFMHELKEPGEDPCLIWTERIFQGFLQDQQIFNKRIRSSQQDFLVLLLKIYLGTNLLPSQPIIATYFVSFSPPSFHLKIHCYFYIIFTRLRDINFLITLSYTFKEKCHQNRPIRLGIYCIRVAFFSQSAETNL